VRDLNPPTSRYSRSASCHHHRDPQSVPTIVKPKLEADPATGAVRTAHRTYCGICGGDME
jgi:hypothetical protein